jgi:transcriptional regulator with XRE-family HTH domain
MATRLEQFLKSRGIKPAHLARESGYSRQHLLRIRKGNMEPTRRCIAAIVTASRRLANEPVLASDLFELGEEERQPSATPPPAPRER